MLIKCVKGKQKKTNQQRVRGEETNLLKTTNYQALTPIRSVHRIRCTNFFGAPDPVDQRQMFTFGLNINFSANPMMCNIKHTLTAT